ncbi:hypothetical protein ARMGADRAFT_904874, partial [Armillaria gallica]
LPLTSPYPGSRSILVLDNAHIHHFQEIKNLVRAFSCRIEFLPLYSSEYNPIEQVWSVIKSHL